MFPIELFDVKTNHAKSALNLAVIFDNNFTFHPHISAVCSSCSYHMRDLRLICSHLGLESVKLHATALVSSHLNYCNSHLYGIAEIDLIRLQRVLNQLARLVTKSPPFTDSVPLVHSLHWWPVTFRMLFKINLLTCTSLRENNLFIFSPCLLHHFHPFHCDQTMIIVCQSLWSRPAQV